MSDASTRLVPGPTVARIPLVTRVPAGLDYAPLRSPDWPAPADAEEPIVFDYDIDAAPADDAPAPDGGERYRVDARGELAYEGHPAGLPLRQRMETVRPGHEYAVRFPSVDDMNEWEWWWKRRLFMYALATRGRGLALHATLLLLPDGRAVAVPGVSGAGKSTLARLLRESEALHGARVLSDDRCALTLERGGRVRAWSTPWYSNAAARSPGSGELAALVLPHHGAGARLRPVARGEISRVLLRTLALPFWSAALMERSLGMLDALIAATRWWEFSYAPVGGEAAALVDRLTHALEPS